MVNTIYVYFAIVKKKKKKKTTRKKKKKSSRVLGLPDQGGGSYPKIRIKLHIP